MNATEKGSNSDKSRKAAEEIWMAAKEHGEESTKEDKYYVLKRYATSVYAKTVLHYYERWVVKRKTK